MFLDQDGDAQNDDHDCDGGDDVEYDDDRKSLLWDSNPRPPAY